MSKSLRAPDSRRTFEDFIQGWYNEVKHFHTGSVGDFGNAENLERTGHYSQVFKYLLSKFRGPQRPISNRLCGARRGRWAAATSSSKIRRALLRTFSISSAITAPAATCGAPRSTPPDPRPAVVPAAARMAYALGSPAKSSLNRKIRIGEGTLM